LGVYLWTKWVWRGNNGFLTVCGVLFKQTMQEQLMDLMPVILVGLVVWMVGLSGFLYWFIMKFNRLGKGVKTGNLMGVLEKVLKTEDEVKSSNRNLMSEIERLDKEAETYIQRVGLTRFNPFNETGGDQSFSLSLLDEKGDGFVLSCLHTRDRTRVYAKPVEKGKSPFELSLEEQKALAGALKK